MRVLVAVKRVVDYAVKVRVRPDKTGAFKILTQPFVPASTLSHTLSILCCCCNNSRGAAECQDVDESVL
eukprot:18636-Heterococcus_DN1.PRE.6